MIHGVISDIECSVVCEHSDIECMKCCVCVRVTHGVISDIERSVVCVFTCLVALFQTLSAV